MTIPASALVSVNPAVLGAGGDAVDLSGLFLTNDTAVPLGTVAQFSTAPAVADFFGAASTEASLAATYFAGFLNKTAVPGNVLFAQYNTAVVGAYLRSASLAGMTLDQLKSIPSGTLTITVDGVSKTSTAIVLSGATSFSNAATLIQAGFSSTPPTVTFDSQRNAFKIASPTTGAASTISFGSGAIGEALSLTAAKGAVTSQGAIAATPAGTMNAVVSAALNWASFTTIVEPDLAGKIAFGTWTAQQNRRFAYVVADTDVNAVVPGNTTAYGPQAAALNLEGSIPVAADPAYAAQLGVTLTSLVQPLAAFVMGAIASIDFGRTNGRVTLAYRSGAGVPVGVADQTKFNALKANGYNCYAAFATASEGFTNLQPGQIAGSYDWIDSYANQINLNASMQSALVNLMVNANSLPYNAFGYSMIESSLLGPITSALDFGSIRAGVTLSADQINAVNAAAGRQIGNTLQTRGWYLLIKDPGATVRAQRGSPEITLFYVDGGSIQTINMASILVQ